MQLPLRFVREDLPLVHLPYGVVELSADALLEAARHEVLGQHVKTMHRRIEHEDIVEGPTGLSVNHDVPGSDAAPKLPVAKSEPASALAKKCIQFIRREGASSDQSSMG